MLDVYAIRRPSGDQAGCCSFAARSRVSCLTPEPSAFISFEDLSLHQFLFDGYASEYNGAVVAGAEVTLFNTPSGGFPAGQGMPIIHDLDNGRMVDLPLPPTGIAGIPTGMSGGRRPRVIGTVTLDGGQRVAVLWTWNSSNREYDVATLPTTNPAANSRLIRRPASDASNASSTVRA